MTDISRIAVEVAIHETEWIEDHESWDGSSAFFKEISEMLLALLARVEELERAVARKDEALQELLDYQGYSHLDEPYVASQARKAIAYTGTENAEGGV